MIKSLTSELRSMFPGVETILQCEASDPDGDTLTYVWSANGGVFSTTQGAQSWTSWKAPDYWGSFVINLTVADGKGGSAVSTINLLVPLI